MPVRLDVDVSGMDACAQKSMATLKDPAKQMPSINFLASPDLRGAVEDVVTQFWNTPSMTTDDFVTKFVGALKAVAFAPEDLALVRGEPSVRRRYLDELLCSRYPRFAGIKADYERVLKQRNMLLRTAYLAKKTGGRGPGSAELATLDAWDAHLAEHGAELLAGRLALLDDLIEPVVKAHARIADGRSEVALAYVSELGDDLTAGHYINVVEQRQEVQAMQGTDDRFSFEEFEKVLIYALFRSWINTARWLIHQNDITMARRQNPPCKCQPLLLTSRQVDSLFHNVGV